MTWTVLSVGSSASGEASGYMWDSASSSRHRTLTRMVKMVTAVKEDSAPGSCQA